MKHLLVNIVFCTLLIAMGIYASNFGLHLGWFLLAGIIWFSIILIGSSYIWSQYHVKAYLGNPSEKENKISLTFDDGPSEFTPKVLDLLYEFNVKATFFCIGKNVDSHPEIANRIVSEGHLIGNHSYSHSKTFDFLGTDAVESELNQTDASIEKATSKKVRFFRPPYGITTPKIARALKRTKHDVIGWNIRSNDGISSDGKNILKRIETRLKPGGIILMHDTSAVSVSVLEQLLLTLRHRNFTVVPVTELLKLEAYE
ncbi:polysaccharide deacetylase family protein [Flavobacterium silvaticum]|uniref:Polysaccharide deacetylase family protein n=1 Tax=Flavobacterium silvaticum TaxID=1852020 RepID=A0A972JG03_9FLAO|nr:polysaccharide deacetylase family protein [Flavobacterium silvaticum]NMH27701.1 polysaccharide deacetylase family protein [Flavobacterium silvaticum]